MMSMQEKIEFIQVEYFTLYNQYLEKCSDYDRLITRLLNQVRRLETVKDNLLDTSKHKTTKVWLQIGKFVQQTRKVSHHLFAVK